MTGKRITCFEFSYPFSIFFEFILFQLSFYPFAKSPKKRPCGACLLLVTMNYAQKGLTHHGNEALLNEIDGEQIELTVTRFEFILFSGFLNLAILLSFYPFSCLCGKSLIHDRINTGGGNVK